MVSKLNGSDVFLWNDAVSAMNVYVKKVNTLAKRSSILSSQQILRSSRKPMTTHVCRLRHTVNIQLANSDDFVRGFDFHLANIVRAAYIHLTRCLQSIRVFNNYLVMFENTDMLNKNQLHVKMITFTYIFFFSTFIKSSKMEMFWDQYVL